METPVTPKRMRPALGARSHTDTPPKSASSPAAAQSKKYHLDLFSNSQHRHHHHHQHSGSGHVHGRDKRGEDKFGSRANLRQQLQAPVAELSQKVSGGIANATGTNQISGQPGSRDGHGDVPALRMPRRPIRPADVEREKQKGRRREEEVRSALSKLSDTAHSNTRRLDTAYYSLLEKIRTLQSTIASLQELSTSTNELHEKFQEDTATVGTETQKQIDAFADFGGQQERVRELESRVKAGMTKAESLDARLEAARRRVETWEAREKEWQAKTSKRLTIGWCALVVLTISILLLLGLRKFTAMPAPKTEVDVTWAKNLSLPSFIIDDIAEISSRRLAVRSSASPTGPVTLPSERRLRAFDEL